jgi:hypothetical protein
MFIVFCKINKHLLEEYLISFIQSFSFEYGRETIIPNQYTKTIDFLWNKSERSNCNK